MHHARLALAVLLCPATLLACAEPEDGARAAEAAPPTVSLAAAHEAFDTVYAVLQHPRCLNCHPAGDRPLQSDDSHVHAMNVVRGPDDAGVAGNRCDGCHGASNGPLPHMPPGVSTGWRLAPAEMVFEGVSKADMARLLLDESRSHMTPEELLEHMTHDPLVLWGWDPGPGRMPVPVPHDELVAAMRTWMDGGAPVPPADAEEEDDA